MHLIHLWTLFILTEDYALKSSDQNSGNKSVSGYGFIVPTSEKLAFLKNSIDPEIWIIYMYVSVYM